MALTDIQKVRLNVGDTDINFPILDDDSYTYFLEKNSNNIDKSSLDAAKAILFQLSTRSSETVDIFSIKGTDAANSYRLALELFIKDSVLNPLYSNLKGWVGGVSKSEMLANNEDLDNNTVKSPGSNCCPTFPTFFTVNQCC